MDWKTISFLNAPTAEQRLENLKTVISGETEKPVELPMYSNNHIHTVYSFSPYSPTAAVWAARYSGLTTCGIMDHDSVGGAREFIEAGKIAGIATTVGMECRVSVKGTALEGRLVNNPDQRSVAYMALHGIPHQHLSLLDSAFAPLREKRNIRNRKMIANINSLVSPFGIELDFDADVLPLSQFADGGSVTERHVLFALAGRIESTLGDGTPAFISDKLGIPLSAKQLSVLSDRENPFYLYSLLGILKSTLIKKIYVPADEELLHISELRVLAEKTNSIFCYAYLGDVKNSVTGDKADRKFEDDYIDILFDTLKEQGVDAVTYMPSRNTPEQLDRVMRMCREYGFSEISGEDINSPGQSFICRELAKPEFSHLIAATRRLIEREKSLSDD